jgi:hypothetical protein
MKYIIALAFVFTAVFTVSAQTPIDDLQKQNLSFLEAQESEGYEFRSQIITEFDQANASQNVNISLSKDYNYLIVALGDSNIPAISLGIKPAKGASIDPFDLGDTSASQAYRLAPSKSGKFKITISANDLGATEKGFISFMVLRK